MTASQPLTVVCMENDGFALKCVKLLGRRTGEFVPVVLKGGEVAPAGSLAFFSGYRGRFPSRHLRAAAQEVTTQKPEWANTTPFVVAVREINAQKGEWQKAVEQIAEGYRDWVNGNQKAVPLPWGAPSGSKRGVSYQLLLEEWLDNVAEILGEDCVSSLLSARSFDKSLRGRGGDVVYNRLAKTGRVVTSPGEVDSGILPNSVYKELAGLPFPVVYGTSDLANVFELLQLLKAGYWLGRPAVFETYPTAHDVRYWTVGFLNPSLNILGVQASPMELGLSPVGKYTQVVERRLVWDFFTRHGLVEARGEASAFAGVPMYVWYQSAMKLVAGKFLDLLGISVQFTFTTFEDLLQFTEVWGMPAPTYMEWLKEQAGHIVVGLNGPDGKQFKTGDPVPNKTIEELHREGWWLGGAGIYLLSYSLGAFGGVVSLVKDSSAGRVNMLAKPFLEGGSGLFLLPVGLFRLSAAGQNEDWTIDPWVLLELIGRWGDDLSRRLIRRVWDAIEVPLVPGHIGRKTVARVGIDWIEIEVQDPKRED